MYNTRGGSWGQFGETNHFLPKSGQKTLFLAVMVPDLLTSEWAGTHNFRGIAKFHKCFEKSGTSASIWAMCKASIFKIVRLAATWKFFRCGHEKMVKTGVFHKTLISRNLLKEAHIQARSMWKLTSRAFRKCGTYWAYQLLNGSYCWSKSDNVEILAPSAKIRGVTKKRHGHNNEFWGLKRIAGPANHVWRPGYSFQAPKIEIVAVSFFRNASFPAKNFSEFDPTLTANNFGLKPPNLKNYHIFGIARTFSFTWYHPI